MEPKDLLLADIEKLEEMWLHISSRTLTPAERLAYMMGRIDEMREQRIREELRTVN